MTASLHSRQLRVSVAMLCVLAASRCTTNTLPPEVSAPAAAMTPEIPPSIRPEDIVGRWGYGAYQKDEERARMEAVARAQCRHPVVIRRGPNGGVMMDLPDSVELQELHLKGSPSGKKYIGPPGEAGGPQDREIVSFDGRSMVLRWMNPETANRYGTGLYERCGSAGTARAGPRPQAR